MARGFELLAAANAAGKHLCVGLDPDPSHARKVVKSQGYGLSNMLLDDADYSLQYALEIVEATAAVAACFKLNYEFWCDYDRSVLRNIVEQIKLKHPKVVVVLDRKYGDIGNTSARSAAFAKKLGADIVTVNPYMGITDVTSEFKKVGIDCFVLGRTSNSGAGELQSLPVPFLDNSLSLAVSVSNKAAEGGHGLVVGATSPDELADIQLIAPYAPFLIPGVGAQGGDLEAVVSLMRQHAASWVVNVGRGIAEASDDAATWREAVKAAAHKYHDAMVPMVKE